MRITRTAQPLAKKADLKLWICQGCDVVHMSVGKNVLSFNRNEFSDLANAVGDLCSVEWAKEIRAFSFLDLAAMQSEAIR